MAQEKTFEKASKKTWKKFKKGIDKRKKMWYTIKAVARGTARTSIRSLKIEQQNFERNMQK